MLLKRAAGLRWLKEFIEELRMLLLALVVVTVEARLWREGFV